MLDAPEPLDANDPEVQEVILALLLELSLRRGFLSSPPFTLRFRNLGFSLRGHYANLLFRFSTVCLDRGGSNTGLGRLCSLNRSRLLSSLNLEYREHSAGQANFENRVARRGQLCNLQV